MCLWEPHVLRTLFSLGESLADRSLFDRLRADLQVVAANAQYDAHDSMRFGGLAHLVSRHRPQLTSKWPVHSGHTSSKV